MNATTSIEASSFLGIILLLCFKILKIINIDKKYLLEVFLCDNKSRFF